MSEIQKNIDANQPNTDIPSSLSMGIMMSSRKEKTFGMAMLEKVSTEQIPMFLKHIEKVQGSDHVDRRLTIILSFFALLLVLSFFTLIVVFLKDTALTKEIVIGLLSFIGGGGLGFGIGKMQKKD
jgi:hypothetical protein